MTLDNYSQTIIVYIGMGQASHHDSVTGLRCLDVIRRLYPDITFARFLTDSSHGAYHYYELLKRTYWVKKTRQIIEGGSNNDCRGMA